MKTKLEIIQETVKFYGDDPSRRAVIQSSETASGYACVYFDPKTGNKCAFGRCANLDAQIFATAPFLRTVPLREKADWVRALVDGSKGAEYANKELNKILLPEYRGHDLEFWSAIQYFHDCDEHFTKTGLSELGKLELENLIKYRA